MSEEMARASGDLAYWQRRAESAEADAAALREALWIARPYVNTQLRICVLCDGHKPLHASHCPTVRHESGTALLSELDAARAVVWAAKAAEFTTVALGLALRNYDAVTKEGA